MGQTMIWALAIAAIAAWCMTSVSVKFPADALATCKFVGIIGCDLAAFARWAAAILKNFPLHVCPFTIHLYSSFCSLGCCNTEKFSTTCVSLHHPSLLYG